MTTHHPTRALAPTGFLLATLATLATACGSDDETLSAAEYQQAANAVCTEAETSMAPIFGAIFPKLDTATADERRSAADDLLAVITQEIDDLAALKPPSDIADDVDAMLQSARQAQGVVRQQGGDFWLDESDPFVDVNQRAAALGLEACAGDSAE